MKVLSKLTVNSPILKKEDLEETAKRACHLLGYKTGFYLTIFDLKTKKVVESLRILAADPTCLEHSISKIRLFQDYCPQGTSVTKLCRGIVSCGGALWSLAGKSQKKDEAICSYLALRFSADRTLQEWLDISREADKNRLFIELDQHFMLDGVNSVRYEEINTF